MDLIEKANQNNQSSEKYFTKLAEGADGYNFNLELTKRQNEIINSLKGSVVYMIDEDGNIIGHGDDTRWRAAKKWQRFLGKIFPRYKRKFIDVRGISIKLN